MNSTPVSSEQNQQARSESQPLQAEIREWIKTIAFAVVIVTVLHLFVFNLSTVKGQSMEPTLQEDEWLFINKIGYIVGEPQHSDVVILKDPTQVNREKKFLVKRIVALAGDTVEVRDGIVFVNGKALQEVYTDIEIEDGDYGPQEVPEGKVFVMGDNRHMGASFDSRSFGAVPLKSLEGKAQFILWPLGKLGSLN